MQHRPPAVAWEVGATRWQQRALIALVLAAAVVWVGFTAEQGWGPASFFVLTALLASLVLAFCAQRNAAKGRLRWDGEQWYWAADHDQLVRAMACVLDFQAMMLLQLTFENRKKQWLWLECGDAPAHWRSMRRAIVFSSNLTQHDVDPQSGNV